MLLQWKVVKLEYSIVLVSVCCVCVCVGACVVEWLCVYRVFCL